MYLSGQLHALPALAPGEQSSVSAGQKFLGPIFSQDVAEKCRPYQEFDPTSLDLQICSLGAVSPPQQQFKCMSQARSRKSRKAPVSFVMFGRPSLTVYISALLQLDRFFTTFFSNIYREYPYLVEMVQLFPALNMKTRVCFVLLAATYVVQQYIRRITVLPRQSFQYLLQCLQRHMYVISTKGTHFCLSMATFVKRTRRSLTLHVRCLPCS